MEDLELTPEETAQIVRQRAAHAPTKLDVHQAELIRQLDELNNDNVAGAHGPCRANLDAETVLLIKRIQAVGIGMKSEPYGHAAPVHVTSRVAFEIIKAIRGEAKPKSVTDGIPVPGDRPGTTQRRREI